MLSLFICFFFFFFKQKTAYEMSVSDWSSDVCSSDLFAVAVPVSTVIGAPISGLLLGLDGVMGLKGWQWLFIIEGIPSVLLGIVTWFYLTDRPEQADWLTGEQKAWLSSRLAAENAAKQKAVHLT